MDIRIAGKRIYHTTRRKNMRGNLVGGALVLFLWAIY
jgi:hypothetical protein